MGASPTRNDVHALDRRQCTNINFNSVRVLPGVFPDSAFSACRTSALHRLSLFNHPIHCITEPQIPNRLVYLRLISNFPCVRLLNVHLFLVVSMVFVLSAFAIMLPSSSRLRFRFPAILSHIHQPIIDFNHQNTVRSSLSSPPVGTPLLVLGLDSGSSPLLCEFMELGI